MSFLAHRSFGALSRSSRRIHSATPYRNYISEQEALQHHAAETTGLWRKISYFVCIPAIAVCVAWVYNAEVEHNAHLDHIRAENDGQLPDPPAYEYLNKRAKPFPWGMNTLFFNPHANKDLSEGAE
jgi:cytochrome c oxidase subunit 6a